MREGKEATQTFRVAVAQIDPHLGERAYNRRVILERMEEAAQAGAALVVFPECALSGYVFPSAEEALPAAETVPGETTEAVAAACRQHNLYAIVGLLERDAASQLFNSAFVAGPEGLIANYRKCHLPVLGIDRFVGKGEALPILELPFARIGILICYDVRFPEAARVLALRGAEVIIVPTNWPQGAESAPLFLTRARAWENRVYVVACNRVGQERGTRFIGQSQIVAPDGTFLAQGDGASETLLYAEIAPAQARQKKLVFEPGVFELDPVGDRRPELYHDLCT
ncbi:MAG TPA: carbon-nitrogen hydrolase family protein [Chthonomonadaceae bacterium]|nr:carbon-nitrogen hydrolase family protein [Chthonomonadaceae bacterium]